MSTKPTVRLPLMFLNGSRLRSRLRAALPPVLIMASVAALTVFAFRESLAPRIDRLPGIDAPLSYVWEVYTRIAFAAGQWPHWNPYFWSGTLHFADTLVAALYPPAVLLRFLEPAAFLRWMAVLHMLLSGAGTLLFARVLGVGWAAAAAASLALAIGGAAGASLHNGHMVVIYCVAWVPWALALAILSVRRGTLLPHPALPLVLVAQFLGGYVQGSLYTLVALCSYYAYSLVWPDPAMRASRWRPLPQLAVLGLLTLGLSAVQAFPFAQLALETARTQGLTYERASAGAWRLEELATFFWPFGNYGSHRIAYVGWLLACAAPFAFITGASRRLALYLLLLTAGAVALALGDALPFYRVHYALFPGLRLPARILFLAALAVALLGALGLDRIVALARAAQWRLLAAGALASGICVAAASGAALQLADGTTTPAVHLGAWLPVATVAALVLLIVLTPRVGRLGLVPALVVVAVDLTAFADRGDHTVPIESPATIRRWLGPADGGRVWSLCPNRVGSNELLLAGRPAVDGPVGVTLQDYEGWLAQLGSPDWPSDVLHGPRPVRRDLLDLANVSTVVACEPLDTVALTAVFSTDSIHVYRNERAWPRAIWTCAAEALPRDHVVWRLRQARYDEHRRLASVHRVHVRWAEGVDAVHRRELEGRYGLVDAVEHEGRTWRYALSDLSPQNVRRLVADAGVEDTNGINRHTGTLAEASPPQPAADGAETQLLIGTVSCDSRGEAHVQAADRPDGYVKVEVSAPIDGVVFLSEPYYPERRAFVDGRPVEAQKANLAFTAVAVPAGRHVVELRLVPVTFHAGLVTTGLTAVGWAGIASFDRRRREKRKGAPLREPVTV